MQPKHSCWNCLFLNCDHAEYKSCKKATNLNLSLILMNAQIGMVNTYI